MNQEKVLLVCDDKSMNRKLIVAILTGTRFKVIEAANGLECLQTMDSLGETVDIILLDISMKDMNGMDVCKAVRDRAGHTGRRHIPIVAYTANAMKGERARFIDAGFDEILIKPIVEDDLLQMLERLVE